MQIFCSPCLLFAYDLWTSVQLVWVNCSFPFKVLLRIVLFRTSMACTLCIFREIGETHRPLVKFAFCMTPHHESDHSLFGGSTLAICSMASSPEVGDSALPLIPSPSQEKFDGHGRKTSTSIVFSLLCPSPCTSLVWQQRLPPTGIFSFTFAAFT